jgi:3-hydroxyacyl-CoA dehydrogenase/enoyl-CoA hydratase/3-hydroxybutyryl-CoA epimerase
MSVTDVNDRMSYLSPTLELTGVEAADLVIEAVVENLAIKKSVFREIEGHVSTDAIIASNTSSLPVTEMATALKHPERFVGMHFFNPVHRMKLVEIIPGKKTKKAVVKQAAAMALKLGKMPVVVKDVPGFLVNRILLFYLMEAVLLMEGGAPIDEVDQAMEAFGMPMGPFALLDEIGLDVAAKVGHLLKEAYWDRMVGSDLLQRMADEGWHGRKNGKGFYSHGSRGERTVRKEVYTLVESWEQTSVSATEIVDRLVLVMVAEASRCLKEKVVASPEALDLAMVFGTGFAPFRGGLWKYAEDRGFTDVNRRLLQLAHRHGPRFESSEALLEAL